MAETDKPMSANPNPIDSETLDELANLINKIPKHYGGPPVGETLKDQDKAFTDLKAFQENYTTPTDETKATAYTKESNLDDTVKHKVLKSTIKNKRKGGYKKTRGRRKYVKTGFIRTNNRRRRSTKSLK
jgi:hypothetical protein